MTGLADGEAFAFEDRMAGYEAKPTPECPTDHACERPLMAQSVSKRVAGGNLRTR